MRIQHTLALIAAATVSLSALAAPASTEVNTEAVSSVHVAGATYKLRPFEFDGVQGVYWLADGRTLRVSSAHHKLYAELGQAKTELVPVAQNTFVTIDESTRLQFDQIPFATEVTVSAAQ
jgi:hypothetical protein